MFRHNALLLVLALLLTVLPPTGRFAAGASYLVKNGESHAEIVISENPPRTTRLAAQELQRYVEKISGTELRVLTAPTDDVPVKIHVGRSAHTDRLGIAVEDLKDGAYRIVSGENWLVFIGDDTDFAPIEPWPRSYGNIRSGKLQEAWNGITGAEWGVPMLLLQIHKHSARGSRPRGSAATSISPCIAKTIRERS